MTHSRVLVVIIVALSLGMMSTTPVTALGSAPIWAREFGTVGFDETYGLAADSSGVYVAGGTQGMICSGGSNSGFFDVFAEKRDSFGTLVWCDEFGTAGQDAAFGAAVDSSGVYVAGYANGPLAPVGCTAGSWNSRTEAFVAQLNLLTGSCLWINQLGSAGDAQATAVAVSGGLVYVVGVTTGSFQGHAYSGGFADAFVAALSTSNGAIAWSDEFGTSTAFTAPRGVGTGPGGVYVVGYTVQFPSFFFDSFVTGLSLTSGAFLWTGNIVHFSSFTSSSTVALAVGVSPTAVYVSGYTSGPLPSPFTGTFMGGIDAMLVKFNAGNGVLQAGVDYGTTADDQFEAITIKSSGSGGIKIYAAGYTGPATTPNVLIQEYNAGLGNLVATVTLQASGGGGSGASEARGLAWVPSATGCGSSAGCVYVGGAFGGPYDSQSFAGGYEDAFVATFQA